MNRKHVLTRRLPFIRSSDVERVKVEKQVNDYRQTMTHIKSEVRQELLADFVLEIDYDALVSMLYKKAAHSRGGKAQIASGIVRLVRRNEEIVKAERLEHPLREGWGEVQS
jgi:hypothetical protein